MLTQRIADVEVDLTDLKEILMYRGIMPTSSPSASPTLSTANPTLKTTSPTFAPTRTQSDSPTNPSKAPTNPTKAPTNPTKAPTTRPTKNPTKSPTTTPILPCNLQVDSKGQIPEHSSSIIRFYLNNARTTDVSTNGVHLAKVVWDLTSSGWQCRVKFVSRYYMHGTKANNNGLMNGLAGVDDKQAFLIGVGDTADGLSSANKVSLYTDGFMGLECDAMVQ